MPTVDAYVMSWHLTQSSAFDLVLRQPFAPFLTLNFHDIDTWQSVASRQCSKVGMFLQVMPPEDAHHYYERVIWVPMWDMIHARVDDFLSRLPASTGIVDFSGQLSAYAAASAFPLMTAQFFFNPDDFTTASPTQQSIFYWNRRSLYTKSELRRLCDALGADVLWWRDKADYILPPELRYSPGKTIGDASVKSIPAQLTRQEYLRYLSNVKLFLAPRLVEGIGLTFLEAMASGCVVIAVDQPTMNTYISHGETGFLVPLDDDIHRQRVKRISSYARAVGTRKRMMMYQLRRLLGRFGRYQSPLVLSESLLGSIASADLDAIGERAREAHYAGYSRWQRQLPVIAEFILEL